MHVQVMYCIHRKFSVTKGCRINHNSTKLLCIRNVNIIVNKLMRCAVLRFTMHNITSALCSQSGRSSVLGYLLYLYVDMWIRRVFCSQYILFLIICLHKLGHFLETWNKLTSQEDNVQTTPHSFWKSDGVVRDGILNTHFY